MAANPQPLQSRPYQEGIPQFSGESDDDETTDDGFDDDRTVRMRRESTAVGPTRCSSSSRTSELTLSFEGEVFVFPAVTREKVQAVLLLLGGRETQAGFPTVEVACEQDDRVTGSPAGRSNSSHRIASLVRFREKRKERCFNNKIRYTVRKEVAQRMHRKNGQFASLREGSASSNLEAKKSVVGSTLGPENVVRKCQHCGVGETDTPAMRRGPDGPRTLCNACGLMWANKGTLRNLSKTKRSFALDHAEPGTPMDIKPSVVEENSLANPCKLRTLKVDSNAVTIAYANSYGKPHKEIDAIQNSRAAVDTTSMLREIPVNSSGNFDKDTLAELDNSSGTDIDIPTNSD